jgi:hypothetical protein
MKINNMSISTLLMFIITACGGISESIRAADNKTPPTTEIDKKLETKLKEPQLQKEWQEKFLELFNKQPKTQKVAFALFSYGGWSNDGQVLLFGEEGKGGVSMYAKPGSKEVDITKNLTAAEFDSFTANSKNFQNLADVDTGVMDGLQFEYVRAVKDDKGQIKVIQRVFMNNPGIGKPAPQHTDLVKLFSLFKGR